MSVNSKILLRTWVPGEGCVHLRAPGLTEDEARAILRAIRSLTTIDWDRSTEVTRLELGPVGLPGLAFAMPSPVQDPDQPQRSAPRLCVIYLPDPDRYLVGAVGCQLRGIGWPTSREELDPDHWIPFDPSDSSTGVRSTPRTCSSRNLARNTRRFVALGLMLSALAAGLAYWLLMPGGESHVTNFPLKTERVNPRRDADEWGEAKRSIQNILKEEWAAQITGTKEVPIGEADLLRSFAGLFRRPSLDGIQDKPALEGLLDSEKAADRNPFTSFLYRLPEQVPMLAVAAPGTDWQKEGQKYLAELAGTLERRGIPIKAGEKVDPGSVRLALDYSGFYTVVWQPKHRDWEGGEYCSGGEDYFKWVEGVRKLLQKRYTWPHNSP